MLNSKSTVTKTKYAFQPYYYAGVGMAFVCPHCEKETLSPRSAEIKVCLKCGNLVDWQKVIKLLEKMGVQKKIIDQVRSDIVDKVLLDKIL